MYHIIRSVRRYNLLCKQCVFVAAYTACNKYRCYCMDILILYCEHIEYTWRWTYPLLMLVCWSGVFWIGVGIGLCDVLFRYVRKTIKTSSFDVREPRFSEFRTFAIPVLMPSSRISLSSSVTLFFFRYVRFAAFVPYWVKPSFSQSLFISPKDALYIFFVKGKGLPQQA